MIPPSPRSSPAESSPAVFTEKACEGARTLEDGDFQECLSCGMRIRWDLVDHPFWGFQNCTEATR